MNGNLDDYFSPDVINFFRMQWPTGQFIAEEDGNDSGRSFIGTETVIVAGGCDGESEKILIIVNGFDDGVSIALTDQITSIPVEELYRYICDLSTYQMDMIDTALAVQLGFVDVADRPYASFLRRN